jgi:hypothetical protein
MPTIGQVAARTGVNGAAQRAGLSRKLPDIEALIERAAVIPPKA